MTPLSDRQHDAFSNPAKAACREGNLRVLREAAFLLWEDGDRTRLRCDWCELMGETGLLTLDLLEREGTLAPGGFVGIDLDSVRIEGEFSQYVRIGDEGSKATFSFCRNCGATVHNSVEGYDVKNIATRLVKCSSVLTAIVSPVLPSPSEEGLYVSTRSGPSRRCADRRHRPSRSRCARRRWPSIPACRR